eukprot:CAMPEP_0116554908 /NCGR_PEP_ID=MMETSP0397-20121206/7846_1 /TAXON_ID=216820 /ORGANISM="Cyclophora tenuis, Strain ECT3854" /LENGTH=202 /DNA_ID=CAMNT_0004080107 /DNA_START=59 /DNA_END=664 /DNA_ORIENTATION=+
MSLSREDKEGEGEDGFDERKRSDNTNNLELVTFKKFGNNERNRSVSSYFQQKIIESSPVKFSPLKTHFPITFPPLPRPPSLFTAKSDDDASSDNHSRSRSRSRNPSARRRYPLPRSLSSQSSSSSSIPVGKYGHATKIPTIAESPILPPPRNPFDTETQSNQIPTTHTTSLPLHHQARFEPIQRHSPFDPIFLQREAQPPHS